MKILVGGVKRMSGPKGNKSGLPFDFAELYGLTLIESVKNDKVTVEGYGFEPAKLPVSEECVAAFKAYEGKYPLVLDLETDVAPFMGKFETVIVGIKAAAAIQKAA